MPHGESASLSVKEEAFAEAVLRLDRSEVRCQAPVSC